MGTSAATAAISQAFGFSGAALSAYAYAPQIVHLVHEQCSAGISLRAFRFWLIASALLATHAVTIGDPVFVVLGLVQLLATGLILFYGHRYRHGVCPFHRNHPAADQHDAPPEPLPVRTSRARQRRDPRP